MDEDDDQGRPRCESFPMDEDAVCSHQLQSFPIEIPAVAGDWRFRSHPARCLALLSPHDR
jgi:hypothetical protein